MKINAINKVPIPHVRQQHKYDCGAAALRSVFEYYDIGPEDNQKFIELCGTNSEDGTSVDDIISVAKEFDIKVTSSNMTLKSLFKALDQEKPIICIIQAYGDSKDYNKDLNGHYVVATGYDNKNIYFEDPSMEGSRGYLPHKEFDKRWHDSTDDTKYDHYGIIFSSDSETDNTIDNKIEFIE